MSKSKLLIPITIASTVVMCALVNMLATYEVKEVVETTEPRQIVIENYTDDKDTHNNYYEYSYDNNYDENKRIDELEAQIEELKKEQSKSEKTTIIKEEETVHIESSQPVQQTTNNNMEPNMVTCDHCGRQGELYENIMRWYDTDGNNNFTHAYCLENYLEATGKESAQKLVNLK